MNRRNALWNIFWLPLVVAVVLATRAESEPAELTPPAPASAVKPGERAGEAPPPERAAEERIRQSLSGRISVDWKRKPLSDAVQEIAKRGGFTAVVDEQSLKDEQIDPATPTTLSMKDATLETVLTFLCEPDHLTWLVADEVLHVTTMTKAAAIQVTRVYDADRVIELAQSWAKRVDDRAVQSGTLHPMERNQRIQLPRAGAGFLAVQPSADRTTFRPLISSERLQPRQPYCAETIRGDILATLLSCSGGPWREVDGGEGTARFHGPRLVVRASHRQQAEVAQFLQAFEQILSGRAESGKAVVWPSATYPQEDDLAVIDALKRPVSLAIEKQSLSEAAEQIAAACNTPVWIDSQGLAAENVPLNRPVSLNVRNVTGRSAWKLLLERHHLATRLQFGRLTITTETRAEEQHQTVVYDVGDLHAATRNGRANLWKLIQDSVSGRFYDVDGLGGEIVDALPGILVVRHSEKIHNEIATLLQDLRRKLPEKPDPNRKPVTLETIETRIYSVPEETLRSDLAKAIPRLIDPPGWNDSTNTMIAVAGKTLVVRQTVRNHIRIAALLQRVRNF